MQYNQTTQGSRRRSFDEEIYACGSGVYDSASSAGPGNIVPGAQRLASSTQDAGSAPSDLQSPPGVTGPRRVNVQEEPFVAHGSSFEYIDPALLMIGLGVPGIPDQVSHPMQARAGVHQPQPRQRSSMYDQGRSSKQDLSLMAGQRDRRQPGPTSGGVLQQRQQRMPMVSNASQTHQSVPTQYPPLDGANFAPSNPVSYTHLTLPTKRIV